MSTARTPEATSILMPNVGLNGANTNNGTIITSTPTLLPSIITATPYLIHHLLLLSIQRLPTLFESWSLLEESINSTEQLSTITLPLHQLTRLFITRMLTKLPSPNKDTLIQSMFSLSITFPNTSVHSGLQFLVSKVLYDRSLPLHYTTTTQQIISTITSINNVDNDNNDGSQNGPITTMGDVDNDINWNNNHTKSTTTNNHDTITKTIIEHHHQDDPRLRYHDYLELDPYNNDILLQYVEFLKETENITDFTTLIQNLLTTHSSSTTSTSTTTMNSFSANTTATSGVTLYIILSDYYSLLHELPKSIQCLKQALLITTTTNTLSTIWLKLGIIYFQLLQKNYSLISLYTSLLYNPDNITTMYYISYIYKRNKQYLLSITWLEKCLVKNKKNILYWLDLGDNLYSLSISGNNNNGCGLSSIEKPLRIYKFAISIASEINDYRSLFPLCLKVGNLLKSHSFNEDAADYFSIILDHLLQLEKQPSNKAQNGKNGENNHKQQPQQHFNKHPYSYILEPQNILFLAEIRSNQGRFEVAKQYLTLLIQQYDQQNGSTGNNTNNKGSMLNTGGESIAQAKAMLKRCNDAIF
jgi:tetratricopeptide (TPR) repeat protein/energy-converting hydrogenase Eha subunit A